MKWKIQWKKIYIQKDWEYKTQGKQLYIFQDHYVHV